MTNRTISSAGQSPVSTPATPDEKTLKAEFDRSPALQHEFLSFENFSAYRRAEAAGKIAVLRGGRRQA
jgi:hypothetical protein